MAFSIKIEGLDQLRAGFEKAPMELAKDIQEATKEAGMFIKVTEFFEAPAFHQDLRGSITLDLTPSTAEIYPKISYAPYVIKGTQPHFPPIEAIRPWAARRGLNPYAMAKSMSKKGTKANPFVQRTADKVGDKVQQIFQKVIDKAINILAGK